jgi:hypothetical protein
MKRLLLFSTAVCNVLFSASDSFSIKREHLTGDQEYTSFAADPRFKAVGFLSTHSPRGYSSCSAVLIHPKLILTAAHCFDPEFKTGFFSLRDSGESDLRDASEIEAAITNPRYVGTGIIRNDIGFGVLKTPIYDIEPMVISQDNPHDFINQTLIAVGYGESGDGSARDDKTHDKKKRATWVKIARYNEPYARLESDFLFPNEKSPLPYGSVSKGDSGGALIAIKPDNSTLLVGITSNLRFEITSLPQSPEKMVIEGLDKLPPRLKFKTEVHNMRNLILSDYFENVGYGIVSNWMSTSDFLKLFILPFNPIKNVEAIRNGVWSSSQTWSGVSQGQAPNNTLSEGKNSPIYFNVDIFKTVTLDKNARIEETHIKRHNSKLMIPTDTSLHSHMVTIDQGEVNVEGELLTHDITTHPGSILSGSGIVRIHPHSNGLHVGGNIRGTNPNNPLIIDGPGYFKPSSSIDAFIQDDTSTHVHFKDHVVLGERFSVNLVFSNTADLEVGQSWTILTAPKIDGNMDMISLQTNRPDYLLKTGKSIMIQLTSTAYEQTLSAKVFPLT